MTSVLVLPGSLRRDSVHRRLAEAADGLQEGVEITVAELGDLPLYDQDLDTDTPPAPVARLRDQVAAADAVLVLTPTNNGSMSAAVKNAIDWASRPREDASLAGKPAAVLTAAFYTGEALDHTAHVLGVAGAQVVGTRHVDLTPLMQAPVQEVPDALDALREVLRTLVVVEADPAV